ncbi:hypothetical protein FIV42_23440 [Persicimonas caeni]|uniref:Recombinase RecT n=1 Tax=Persicimonas caeni TaxID=2292766 RepID=A0A4Y6PZ49_PERCE|nr:hypothetical protein [Persicimonas caeni]QDG53588.1 hypothetical protein FIV42_23440 [Persicimonas caeni]QED34809.1 hypothetical protein FRD00_23435 [Persicimonas caeni]
MATPPNQKTPEATSEPRDAHGRAAASSRQTGALGTGRYEPRDLAELMRYCKIVVQSDLCPRHIKSPADAMLIIQRGAELGLSAVNALQNLNVINGKVTMPAALAVGVVKASEACEYFTCIESTDEYSTWETKRRGNPEPTRYTFSKHDAQVAGLWGSGTWRKYPRNLLAARASMNLARMEYQDVLVGVYTPEEMEDVDEPSRRPSPAPSRSEPAPEPAAAPEPVAEAPAEQTAPVDPTASVHWSEQTVARPRDKSRTKKWQKQNERFHALMRTNDVEEHCDAFRDLMKDRHDVESWTHIPAELLQKWCDVIAKRSDEVDGEGDEAMSERARWVVEKLEQHAEHAQKDGEAGEADNS